MHNSSLTKTYAILVSLVWLGGCNQCDPTPVVAEGVIYSVKYDLGEGRTGGFTRLNMAQAVPGGNGSWNVDARGKLTRDFLIITYPNKPGLGPHVIPVRLLHDMQFGDGGMKDIATAPAAPNDHSIPTDKLDAH